jgi:V8-like Glu-specific endopeptidase
MARASFETPHDGPVAAQSFSRSLHRAGQAAKGFAGFVKGCGLAALAVGALSCSSRADSDPAVTAYAVSAIEDGTTDDAHTFAVGVVQVTQGELAFCSGVLLAPNLVATARHCVAQTPSEQIDCASSKFGAVLPVGDLLVTTDTVITPKDNFAHVLQIVVPSGANETGVCGNDIALMILDQNISLPQYVEPTINPPMTDHSVYSTSVTAIGYGLSTPTDEAGVTAGTRRVKENIPLYCIPNDTTFANCFSDPMASQVLSADEFVSGDASTCEGDSGSGAFDQASFNRGQWVAFGVLSRGAVSTDGKTCIQPVYSRFDAWGSLLIGAAAQAASMGGYSPPVWAGGSGPALTATIDAASTDDAAAKGDASSPGEVTMPPIPGTLPDGKACGHDSDCEAQNCVSTDDVTFVCASRCSSGACATGFVCTSGYCFEPGPPAASSPDASTATPTVSHAKGGCAVSAAPQSGGGPSEGSMLCVAAMVGAATARRRSRSRGSVVRRAA